MCGRFTLEPIAKFYERFQIDNRLETLVPRYNIAPSQEVPVIIRKSPNTVMLMRWGLIPHWAKDPKIGYKMINARAETLAQKPSFRSSLRSKRCLVPASGFFEWHKSPDGKIPYYIHLKEEPLFAFAGLYDIWKNEKGKEVYTFTIITTSPNPLLKNIHDRMPVVLDKEEESPWVDPNETDPFALLKMLNAYPQDEMEAYPVSTLVNKPENDFPSVIKRRN